MSDDAVTALKKLGDIIIQLRYELSAEKKVTEMLVALAAGQRMRPATALQAARQTVASLPTTNPNQEREVKVLIDRFDELIEIDKVTATLPPVEIKYSGGST